ncbi:MAG: hypothetical protein U0841_23220 [Chloroflexia bacterium]
MRRYNADGAAGVTAATHPQTRCCRPTSRRAARGAGQPAPTAGPGPGEGGGLDGRAARSGGAQRAEPAGWAYAAGAAPAPRPGRPRRAGLKGLSAAVATVRAAH